MGRKGGKGRERETETARDLQLNEGERPMEHRLVDHMGGTDCFNNSFTQPPASSCTVHLPVSCLAAKPIKRGNTSKDMHGMIRHMNSSLAFSETILKELESFLSYL